MAILKAFSIPIIFTYFMVPKLPLWLLVVLSRRNETLAISLHLVSNFKTSYAYHLFFEQLMTCTEQFITSLILDLLNLHK